MIIKSLRDEELSLVVGGVVKVGPGRGSGPSALFQLFNDLFGKSAGTPGTVRIHPVS